MPHPCSPCNICVHWLNCFPAITWTVADGLAATSDPIIPATGVAAVGISSTKCNRKSCFSRVRNVCESWERKEHQDYILFFHRKKMGWKWDIAVIPFPLRSSAWLCPFPTSCTLRGQREKQERPRCWKNTAQQYVKLLVSYQDCFGHRSNSQHHASFALCYWQIVMGPPPSRKEFWEAWLLLCAVSSYSCLQSG